MGGFRTVVGGFSAIFAGILALILGLLSPSVLGVSSEHYLAGFLYDRWVEISNYIQTVPVFGWVWFIAVIIWDISVMLLIFGGFIGFWRGGYSALIGTLLYVIFDVIVNTVALLNGLGTYAIGNVIHLNALVVLIFGLFGGILQASAKQ